MSKERAEPTGELWSVRDLADMAGVTTSYIRRLVRLGKILGHKVGRDWVISRSEARRWLQERKD